MNQIFKGIASGVGDCFDEAANFVGVDVSEGEVGFVAHQEVFRAVMEAIDVAPDEAAQGGRNGAGKDWRTGLLDRWIIRLLGKQYLMDCCIVGSLDEWGKRD